MVVRLFSQGYRLSQLEKSFKKFYGRYQDVVEKFQRLVKEMVKDSFPGKFCFASSKVLVLFLLFYMNLLLGFVSTLFLTVGCDSCRLLNPKYLLVVLLAKPISYTSKLCMDFVEIFSVSLNLSFIYFACLYGC